jgi:hypothetical protein
MALIEPHQRSARLTRPENSGSHPRVATVSAID